MKKLIIGMFAVVLLCLALLPNVHATKGILSEVTIDGDISNDEGNNIGLGGGGGGSNSSSQNNQNSESNIYYTVTFDIDDRTLIFAGPTVKVLSGGTVKKPRFVEKSDSYRTIGATIYIWELVVSLETALEHVVTYKFKGWYLDNETFKYAFDFSSKITNDLTLYPKWEIVEKVRISPMYSGGMVREFMQKIIDDQMERLYNPLLPS